MTRIFGKKWEIEIHDGVEAKVWDNLDCNFRVTLTSDSAPNEMDLDITNQAGGSRDFVYRKDLNVTLRAGYIDSFGEIFRGNIEHTTHAHDVTEWNTNVFCKDGGAALRTLRISASFKKDTPIYLVIDKVIKSLTLPPKVESQLESINTLTKGKIDILPVPQRAPVKKKKRTKKQGEKSYAQRVKDRRTRLAASRAKAEELKAKKAIVLRGSAERKLSLLCDSYGLKWEVVGQKLNIMPIEATVSDEIFVLDKDSGLIGHPTPLEKGWRFPAKMNWKIKPNMYFNVESEDVSGLFVAVKVEHIGDTRSDEWSTFIEGVAA